MANVQRLEDRFTAIPNELLEAVYSAKFTVTELRTVLVVIRFTYGFRRNSAELSLSFLSSMTEIPKRTIERAITALIANKVIFSVSGGSRKDSRMLGVNKNYSEWNVEIVLKPCSNSVKKVLKTRTADSGGSIGTEEKNRTTDTSVGNLNASTDAHVDRTTDTGDEQEEKVKKVTTTNIFKHSPLYPPAGEKSKNGAGRTLPDVKNFSGPCIDYSDYNNETMVDLLSGLSFSRKKWRELEEHTGTIRLAQYYDKLRDGYLNRGWKFKSEIPDIITRWYKSDIAQE